MQDRILFVTAHSARQFPKKATSLTRDSPILEEEEEEEETETGLH